MSLLHLFDSKLRESLLGIHKLYGYYANSDWLNNLYVHKHNYNLTKLMFNYVNWHENKSKTVFTKNFYGRSSNGSCFKNDFKRAHQIKNLFT